MNKPIDTNTAKNPPFKLHEKYKNHDRHFHSNSTLLEAPFLYIFLRLEKQRVNRKTPTYAKMFLGLIIKIFF